MSTKSKRNGVMMVDVVAALALLAVLLGVSLKLFGFVASNRQLQSQRNADMLVATNVMEQIESLPWTELTAEKLAQFPLSAADQRVLGAGKVSVAVDELADDPAARRIRVEVTRPSFADGPPLKTRLIAWRYRNVKR